MIWNPLDILFLWISGWKWFRKRNEMVTEAIVRAQYLKGLKSTYGDQTEIYPALDVCGLKTMNADYIVYKNKRWDTSLTDKMQTGEERPCFFTSKPMRPEWAGMIWASNIPEYFRADQVE